MPGLLERDNTLPNPREEVSCVERHKAGAAIADMLDHYFMEGPKSLPLEKEMPLGDDHLNDTGHALYSLLARDAIHAL